MPFLWLKRQKSRATHLYKLWHMYKSLTKPHPPTCMLSTFLDAEPGVRAHTISTFARSTPTWSTLTISTSHEINWCVQILNQQFNSERMPRNSCALGSGFARLHMMTFEKNKTQKTTTFTYVHWLTQQKSQDKAKRVCIVRLAPKHIVLQATPLL